MTLGKCCDHHQVSVLLLDTSNYCNHQIVNVTCTGDHFFQFSLLPWDLWSKQPSCCLFQDIVKVYYRTYLSVMDRGIYLIWDQHSCFSFLLLLLYFISFTLPLYFYHTFTVWLNQLKRHFACTVSAFSTQGKAAQFVCSFLNITCTIAKTDHSSFEIIPFQSNTNKINENIFLIWVIYTLKWNNLLNYWV